MLTTKTSDTAEDMDIISNNGDSGEEDVVLDNAAPVKKRKKLIRLRQIDDSDASDSDGGGGKHNDIKNNEISSNNEHLVSEIDIQDKESVGVPRESPALKPSEKNVTPNDEVKSSKDVASKTPTRIADTESPKPENPTPAANKSNTAQKSQIKTSTQAPSYVKMAKKNTSNPFAFAAAGKAGKAKAKKSAKNTGKLTSFFAAKDSGKAAANETSEKETAKTKSESVENAPVTSPTTKSSIVVKTTETDTPKSADSHTTKTTASVSVENGVSVQEKMKESIATTKGTLKNVSVDESDLKAVTPVKGEDYDPTAVKYHPIKSACWAKGKDVPFLAVCKVFDAIENDSGRHAKQNILSNLYRSIIVLSPEQLADTVHLTMNRQVAHGATRNHSTSRLGPGLHYDPARAR
ncbi:hypothetical protein SARC_04032 [Sphaeroforma arctica JP610]|uniref:Uncharacterized protein n=1 Tax=Sphaeroforma arctica JP610 TaxID=667725 RepID=A0A0L0G3P2_9EUKA|nr:hypothetical protein SARC_04032 [Sphaeroforma arctica JP610]KNC83727.1 hypothetical protein SARC_04032 [Sphaeroforma arctica JP610]|eukprot:XP_014157629.1 hypothetical protein SARC_04032 [Sphaeroforma arctica JP610]